MRVVVEDCEERKGTKLGSRMCRRLYTPVLTWLFLLAKRVSFLKGGNEVQCLLCWHSGYSVVWPNC